MMTTYGDKRECHLGGECITREFAENNITIAKWIQVNSQLPRERTVEYLTELKENGRSKNIVRFIIILLRSKFPSVNISRCNFILIQVLCVHTGQLYFNFPMFIKYRLS